MELLSGSGVSMTGSTDLVPRKYNSCDRYHSFPKWTPVV